jgi:transposase-like protein
MLGGMTDKKERAEIVRRFHEGRQGRRTFAQENGIALSTLGYWIRQERRKGLVRPVSAPVQIQEVKVGMPRGFGLESSWAMEVISPTGLTIRSREALPPAVVIRLLRR